jgi:hypothetical protein
MARYAYRKADGSPTAVGGGRGRWGREKDTEVREKVGLGNGNAFVALLS